MNTEETSRWETKYEERPLCVDAGMLLIVDPCYLPPSALREVTLPRGDGEPLGRVVAVPGGDMTPDVQVYTYGALSIQNYLEPCPCEGMDKTCEICEMQKDDPFVRPWAFVEPDENWRAILDHWDGGPDEEFNEVQHLNELNRQLSYRIEELEAQLKEKNT